MAKLRGRFLGLRLPTIKESDQHPYDDGFESEGGGFLQCIVLVMLVLVLVCCVGVWANSTSTGHFADVRYVDSQINGLQSQMAMLQLTVESQGVLGELNAIRDSLRAMNQKLNSAGSTPLAVAPSSTAGALGAADFQESVMTTPPIELLGAADYEPGRVETSIMNEPATTDADVEDTRM